MRRRTVVTGLAGLAATTALPTLAQGIGRQTDPYGQVDPYADPRNGGWGTQRQGVVSPDATSPHGDPIFDSPEADPVTVSATQEEEEVKWGYQGLTAFLEKKGGPYPDARVQNAMAAFASPFVKACDRPNLPWEFIVNRLPGFQASAWSGGKITMYPAVFSVADHPGEAASIVAHEMGHVVYSHTYHKVKTAMMLQDIPESPAKKQMEKAMKYAGGSLDDLLLKSYGRENEYQADSYVITLFERTGIHPKHALTMFEKMMKYYSEAPSTDNSLFSTHPGTLDRMNRIRELVKRMPPPGQEVVLPGWETLKTAFPTLADFKTRSN